MITIPITYTGQTPAGDTSEEIVSGQRLSLRVKFTFSSDWELYTARTAVFESRCAVRKQTIDEDGYADVPAAVIHNGIRYLKISAFGLGGEDGAEIHRYNGRPITYRVDVGGDVPTDKDEDATAYEKLLIRLIAVEESLGTAVDYANEAGDRANASADEADRAAAEARAEVEAADNAAARALASQKAAAKSEEAAAQSASDSALSAEDALKTEKRTAALAEKAEASVLEGAYISFWMDEDGALWMDKTQNADELNFYADENGAVYMEVTKQ